MERHDLSQSQLANLLGVSQSAVSQWLAGKLKMRLRRASHIEKKTGGEIKRHKLFPRLFKQAA